jgi:hypothetical protein
MAKYAIVIGVSEYLQATGKFFVPSIVIMFIGFFAWYFVEKPAEQCTYAVFVADSKTNRALSGVEVTYNYSNQPFTGYSDSEGYYRTTIRCDKDAYPLVSIKAQKQGYEVYSRHIAQNLQHVEEIRLEEKIDPIILLHQKADSGDIESSNKLAGMYKTGDGVRKSYIDAYKYFLLGAENGDKEAQTQLGIMCEKGQFVKQDYAKAIEWYQKAASQGYPEAQSHLGRMIHDGKGVEKNEEKGILLLLAASRNGFMQAESVIAEINRTKRIQKPISEEEPTKEFINPKESDLEIIQQLEQEINRKLEKVSLNDIWRKSTYAINKNNNVISLNLYEININTFPNLIFSLNKLQKLGVYGTKIEQLPDSFTQLQNLSYLYLGNYLDSLCQKYSIKLEEGS